MEVGSCVICTQNLCISNVSSLPCGHTFHYNCIRRWLVQSQQCPTCRAASTPMNIVKRLYFANCTDKAVNDSKTSVTDSDTKSKKMDKCDVGHRSAGNDENCNNNSGDSEDEEVDSDFTGSDEDSSMSSSESEDLDYHDSSDAGTENDLNNVSKVSLDMTSLLEASASDTSSVSLGTFSDAVSETDAVNHDNMETPNSFNDHEEVGNDYNNYTSVLRIERISDDGDDGDDDDTSDDEDSFKSDDSDNRESQEYSRLLNHFTFELQVFNRNIL
ncbi:Ring finger domain family protein [Brugia pahangi]|uniref:RING-type domain-containing protein n=1 Tax=Brugia pahangi TaxID=6280 RepID=A0A0N4TIZ8_BRUPA|nr:unnamed protein product [Brugia pahangi]